MARETRSPILAKSGRNGTAFREIKIIMIQRYPELKLRIKSRAASAPSRSRVPKSLIIKNKNKKSFFKDCASQKI